MKEHRTWPPAHGLCVLGGGRVTLLDPQHHQSLTGSLTGGSRSVWQCVEHSQVERHLPTAGAVERHVPARETLQLHGVLRQLHVLLWARASTAGGSDEVLAPPGATGKTLQQEHQGVDGT